MSLPKISIITVVYNAAEALAKTIDSVRELKYPNIEYVIVDGGSKDGTKKVIEENYLDITQWISEPDKGIYDAMNKGMALATGDYIWFLNAGDIAFDEYVLDTIFLGSEKFFDLYYGDTLVVSQEGGILGLRSKKPPKMLRWKSFRRGMTVCHQSIIVRRSVVPKYNLKYRYSSDVDWVINTLKGGITVSNTHSIISVFEDGGATTTNRWKSLKERWVVMRTHYGLFSTILSHLAFCLNIFKKRYRVYNNRLK